MAFCDREEGEIESDLDKLLKDKYKGVYELVTDDSDDKTQFKKKIKFKSRGKSNFKDFREFDVFETPDDLELKLRRVTISDNNKLVLCGSVWNKVDKTRLISVEAEDKENVLLPDTIIFDQKRNKVGLLHDVFGRVGEQKYAVMTSSQKVYEEIEIGTKVYCAPDVPYAFYNQVASTVAKAEVDNDDDSDISDNEKEKEMSYIIRPEGRKKNRTVYRRNVRNSTYAFGSRRCSNPNRFSFDVTESSFSRYPPESFSSYPSASFRPRYPSASFRPRYPPASFSHLYSVPPPSSSNYSSEYRHHSRGSRIPYIAPK